MSFHSNLEPIKGKNNHIADTFFRKINLNKKEQFVLLLSKNRCTKTELKKSVPETKNMF